MSWEHFFDPDTELFPVEGLYIPDRHTFPLFDAFLVQQNDFCAIQIKSSFKKREVRAIFSAIDVNWCKTGPDFKSRPTLDLKAEYEENRQEYIGKCVVGSVIKLKKKLKIILISRNKGTLETFLRTSWIK